MVNIRRGIINSWVMMFSTGITIILTFLQRSFFIQSLGETALGLNSLFNSILSAISIADVGLDTVLLFILFEPLKNKNEAKIYKLLIFIRKLYFSIAGIIFTAGICIAPFLSRIINGTHVTPYIVLIYMLYLVNAICTYCFAEYRVLLNANQQSYIVSVITFCVTVIMIILQIASLKVYRSFAIFELIQIVATILMGIFMLVYTKKHIKMVKTNEKISHYEKIIILKNGIGGLSNRIGTFVVFGSDSVLLSIFTNLITVARYSNYMMVVNAAVSIVMKSVSAMMPSIGHQVLSQNKVEKTDLFEIFNHVVYTISFVIFGVFLFSADYFIGVWLGEKQILAKITTLLIAFNMLIRLVRLGPLNYIDALGLQWAQRWKPVIEALVNLIASVLMLYVFKLGLNGILIGTLISNITTVIWMEPRVVFQNGVIFRRQFIVMITRMIIMVSIVMVGFFVFYEVPSDMNTAKFLLHVFICSLLVIIIALIEFITSFHGHEFLSKFVTRGKK